MNLRKSPPSKSVEFSSKIEGPESKREGTASFLKADAHDENKTTRRMFLARKYYSAAFSMINSHNARDRQVTRSLYAANNIRGRDSHVRAAGSKQRHEIIELRTGRLFPPRPTLQ